MHVEEGDNESLVEEQVRRIVELDEKLRDWQGNEEMKRGVEKVRERGIYQTARIIEFNGQTSFSKPDEVYPVFWVLGTLG